MKNGLTSTLLLAALWLAGCSADPKSAAEKANDERIDKVNVGISDEAKKDAKFVAKALVDLASMSLTETELSKLAQQKATNPEVRALAQRALNEHQQAERELRGMAAQLSITLPTTLSNDGQDRLDELQKETGTAFDLQYLKEMADLNNEAENVADDLRDRSPNDVVKTFARKLIDTDTRHRDLAKQLRNALE